MPRCPALGMDKWTVISHWIAPFLSYYLALKRNSFRVPNDFSTLPTCHSPSPLFFPYQIIIKFFFFFCCTRMSIPTLSGQQEKNQTSDTFVFLTCPIGDPNNNKNCDIRRTCSVGSFLNFCSDWFPSLKTRKKNRTTSNVFFELYSSPTKQKAKRLPRIATQRKYKTNEKEKRTNR